MKISTRFPSWLQEFIVFGILQARACIFVGSFLLLLLFSNHIPLFGFHRYDFLFLGSLLIQIILVLTKVETKDEVKMIFLFHILGLVLEIFKTHPAIGSWSYPEEGFFKIMNVPLYSGFMYAAIGSYIAQAWKLMKVELTHFPAYKYTIPLSVLIYLNFYTHHVLPDFRWILMAAVLFLFRKTWVHFKVTEKIRRMPMALAYFLMAFFIWVAENISSYLGAFKYPDQLHEWNVVSLNKISSWTLLVIISFIIVADLKHFKKQKAMNKLI